MEKEDKGRIDAVGSTGNQIAVARKRQQGSDTIITIVPVRTMPFLELYNRGRSTHYPFGFMQVELDANGKGTTQIMAAAKIRFDKKKKEEYEIESYGNQYIKAVNIQPWQWCLVLARSAWPRQSRSRFVVPVWIRSVCPSQNDS